MTKQNCCCLPTGITFDTFCCNPILFTDFITLYGDNMAEHAEVSPGDWIALRQERGKNQSYVYPCTFLGTNACNCCCSLCNQTPTSRTQADGSDSTNTNISSLNANNVFDKNNIEGTIKKQGKSKPKDKSLIYSNNKFLSNKSLSLSRNKKQNPFVSNFFVGSPSGNKNYYSVNGIDAFNIIQNTDQNVQTFAEGVTLYFNDYSVYGKYVLGATLSPQEFVEYTDKFTELTNNLLTDDGVSVLENVENRWCPAKCNALFTCCEDDPDCPPSICDNCCCAHNEVISTAKYFPIYFAYKYSGCHFVWYPREYLFDRDPNVAQCVSTKGQSGLEPENSTCTSTAVASCGLFSGSFVDQGSLGVVPNEPCVWPLDLERIGAGSGKPNTWPCHCAEFPHIHGGAIDSVLCRANVSEQKNNFGYIPQFRMFYPPMEATELGCCWCSSFNTFLTTEGPLRSEQISVKRRCGALYPFANAFGKSPSAWDPCRPGFCCYYRPGQGNNSYGGNPGYETNCFKYGISPYLLRIAKTKFKTGYDVFGSDGKHNFGPDFTCTEIAVSNILREYKFTFRKNPTAATSLKEQCIGFVQLEHHFECCAFRSNAGIATKDPGIIINACNYSIFPFEVDGGYPGSFIPSQPGCPYGTRARFTPYHYSANLWQIKRSIPRRVMYAGSGIPVFKFDLVNMENWSFKNPAQSPDGTIFSAETFLEHWYRYFFGLISFSGKGCTQLNAPGEPLEWDYSHYIDSYDYVTKWLEYMVVAGILRIKDHAIDIAKEVNDIIGSGQIVGDQIVISDQASKECGGASGYLDLVNFFDVDPGTRDVTPKKVKEKLLNLNGLSTYDGPGTESGSNQTAMRAFLPRRAKLPLGPTDTKIYAWGCSGPSPAEQIEDCTDGWCYQSPDGISCCLPGITCPNYVTEPAPGRTIGVAIDVPAVLNLDQGPLGDLSPKKVITGLAGTIVIDKNGKLAIFGGIPEGGDGEPCPVEIRNDFPGQEGVDYTVDCSIDMHPSSITSIPWYLDLFYTIGSEGFQRSDELIPDGNVIDVAFNQNLAVALVDFRKKGLGAICDSSIIDDGYYKLSWEWYEWDPNYQSVNTNGSNLTLKYRAPPPRWEPTCILQEPWGMVVNDGDVNEGQDSDSILTFGARTPYSDGPKIETYRLKSWGSKGQTLGTFSLSYEDAQVHNNGSPFINNVGDGPCGIVYEDFKPCVCNQFDASNPNNPPFFNRFRGFDPTINPNNLRYPGTNTWFIWTAVAAGQDHFAALDDFGGVFISALSSNADNQSTKGKPLPYFNINIPESWPQQGFRDPQYYQPDYSGFESRFNYFNHIPRPGFIEEENWSQDLYNSLTSKWSPYLNCNGACVNTVSISSNTSNSCNISFQFGGYLPSNASIKPLLNSCFTPGGLSNPQDEYSDCVKPIKIVGAGLSGACGASGCTSANYPETKLYDLSSFFLGSLCQRSPEVVGEELEAVSSCLSPTGKISQQPYNDFQPRYTKVTAGPYNTMLLTNENRVEIYGTYYQIDENGQKIGPVVTITNPDGSTYDVIRGITCYVPTIVTAKQGTWGLTYGCPIYCPGITADIPNATNDYYIASRGVTHYPIISATYNPPTTENEIEYIRSSADYSIAITKGNDIYVWGDASMVPGGYCQATYYPGLKFEQQVTLAYLDPELPTLASVPNTKIKIKNVAVGIHSFYIHYEIRLANGAYPLYRTCSYTRYGRNDFGTKIPTSLQNKELISISAGNGFAVAIAGSGEGPKYWDESSLSHIMDYQYKGFAGLPPFLRRDAFFHAIPGNWDYSKWLWGGNCCSSITNPLHPVLQSDACSALAYNIYRDPYGNALDPSIPDYDSRRFNTNKSFSGHPEHLWLRSDIRRLTEQSFLPGDPGCDAGNNIDGAKPNVGNDALGNLGTDFGYCFARIGPAWASGYPQSPLNRTRKKVSVSGCYIDPCVDEPLMGQHNVRKICSDKPAASYICKNALSPFQTSYSTNKDNFISKTIFYSSIRCGSGIGDVLGYDYYTLDYFKYSQRNFYLGYDSDKDTWEIYKSPDILRDTVTNHPVETELCCDLYPEGSECPPADPNTWLCKGATTTTQIPNYGWGGGVTTWIGDEGKTWASLSSYPMVGPNYTRLDYDKLPLHFPNQYPILKALLFGLAPASNSCDSCYGGNDTLTKFAGPGGIAFDFAPIVCNNNIPGPTDIVRYKPTIIETELPSKMLYGVKNEISQTIPPQQDPDYKSIGFRAVLENPQYTNINYLQIVNEKPVVKKFEFIQGTPGIVKSVEHGLCAGSLIVFENLIPVDISVNVIGGTSVILPPVKIKDDCLDPSDPECYLQVQTPYFITTIIDNDKFTISQSPEDSLNGIALNFFIGGITSGSTGSVYQSATKWYPLFDELPSNYNGIYGVTYGSNSCFIGTNDTSCYDNNNQYGISPIDGNHVIIHPGDNGGIGAIAGFAYICTEYDCCGS